MSIPIGLVVTDILVVNNLRDLENDRSAGKHTLAVLIGERWTRIQYVGFIVVSFMLLPVLIWREYIANVHVIGLALVALGDGPRTQVILTQRGCPLNAALAATGQTALAFSLLFFVGILL